MRQLLKNEFEGQRMSKAKVPRYPMTPTFCLALTTYPIIISAIYRRGEMYVPNNTCEATTPGSRVRRVGPLVPKVLQEEHRWWRENIHKVADRGSTSGANFSIFLKLPSRYLRPDTWLYASLVWLVAIAHRTIPRDTLGTGA